jgi:asparagine synthase (glutamine-hydrolysing)
MYSFFHKLRLRGMVETNRGYEKDFIYSSAFVGDDILKKILKMPNIEEAVRKRLEIFDQADGERGDIRKALNYDMVTYLIDLLNRQDKMSMAQSVESRVPFLNYRLIDQVRSQRVKSYIDVNIFQCIWGKSVMYNHSTKKNLKKLAVKYFGKKFAYRDKSGFPLPLREMINGKKFSEHMEQEIMPCLTNLNVFEMEEIHFLWDNKNSISGAEIEVLWVIIAFGEWANIFLGDKKKVVKTLS